MPVREEYVESLKKLPSKVRSTGSSTVESPHLSVVMKDGGCYQCRDRFGEEGVAEESTLPKIVTASITFQMDEN